MDKASDCKSEECGFESHPSLLLERWPEWQGRGFENRWANSLSGFESQSLLNQKKERKMKLKGMSLLALAQMRSEAEHLISDHKIKPFLNETI